MAGTIQISSKAFALLPVPGSSDSIYLKCGYSAFKRGRQKWGRGESHIVGTHQVSKTQLGALAKYARAQLKNTTNDDKTRLKIAIARLEKAAEEMGS